ncbi:MAG: response regulator, partial [Spirochaetaceae bacterium]|nr:response regulator [Spirochaetaceae bacterium]
TLPVAEEAAAADAVRSRSRPAREGREPVPILVVDDDPQMLRFLRDALAAAGYAPIVTGGHEELSRIIQREEPRLGLLGLMLPGTDGIEMMGSVPELADLPVIFISCYGRDETIARAGERR